MAPPFVTHLECSATGARLAHDRLHGLSPAGAPLLLHYDLEAIGRAVRKADLAARPPDMWRYREFLPLAGGPDGGPGRAGGAGSTVQHRLGIEGSATRDCRRSPCRQYRASSIETVRKIFSSVLNA